MKKTRWIAGATFTAGLFLFAGVVSADTLAQQLDKSATYINQTTTGDFFSIDLPSNLFAGRRLDTLTINAQGQNAFSRFSVEIRCWMDAGETTRCPGVLANGGTEIMLFDIPSASGQRDWLAAWTIGDAFGDGPYSAASTTLPVNYDHASLRITKAAGSGNLYYGNMASGFPGALPYYIVTGGVSIDWTGVNATTTALTSLYQNGATSTLDIIRARCTGSAGGVFGEATCATFAFLFVPDPTIVDRFADLPSTMALRFPFSWYNALKSVYSGLVASSTSNMASVSIALSAYDPATSTAMGHILPNMTILSSTTINKYMPSGMLATLLALESAALYLLFAFYVYRSVQNRWLRV